MPSRPKHPQIFEPEDLVAFDREVLAQGDIFDAVLVPRSDFEPVSVVEEDGSYVALEVEATKDGLFLVPYQLVPIMLISFDCEIFKCLRSLLKRGLSKYSSSDIIHIAAVRPMPEDAGTATNIRSGNKFGAVYMPPFGEVPERFIDLYSFQPIALRAVIKRSDRRIASLTTQGKLKAGAFLAQYLGDESRRDQTQSDVTPLERSMLAEVRALFN